MKYEYWFANIIQLSDEKKRKLRTQFQSGERIFNIEERELCSVEFLNDKDRNTIKTAVKNSGDIKKEYADFLAREIAFIPYFKKEYPKRLQEIETPPYALYVKGKLPDNESPSVGIVGARNCTPYGRQMAVLFSEELAKEGVQIISGMARGVDGAGQRGALNVGGRSYGVLGCGVDVCYPKENKGLYADLPGAGGILSEFPIGAPPLREHFPARNRIISGLSDAILVMEAKERSGSLITADIALDQGKDVYALPGPVTSALSAGCNYLIKQGAGILLSPEDLLNDLKITTSKEDGHIRKKTDKTEKVLETTENMLYSCLDLYPKSLNTLVQETKLAPAEVLDKLISLELKGYIQEISKNYYILIDCVHKV